MQQGEEHEQLDDSRNEESVFFWLQHRYEDVVNRLLPHIEWLLKH